MTLVADPGTHGSSTLVPERVGGDTEVTWTAVLAFLHGLEPDAVGTEREPTRAPGI
jgi:hypothetical protein